MNIKFYLIDCCFLFSIIINRNKTTFTLNYGNTLPMDVLVLFKQYLSNLRQHNIISCKRGFFCRS